MKCQVAVLCLKTVFEEMHIAILFPQSLVDRSPLFHYRHDQQPDVWQQDHSTTSHPSKKSIILY